MAVEFFPKRSELNVDFYKANYTVFDGKIGRDEYLTLFLKLFLPVLIICFLAGFILGAIGLGGLSFLITLPLAVINIIGQFSIAIRRLNDLGQTGWFSLALLIPFVNILMIIYLALTPSKTI